MRFTRFTLGLLCTVALAFTGCAENTIHRKSVSDLSQKAYAMMNAGDYAGSISRLESAADLMPEEGALVYDLAIAYQRNEQPEKAVTTFERFLKTFPNHESVPNALKSLAVVEEALGDKAVADALALEDDKTHLSDKKPQYDELKVTAAQRYESAIEHFKRLGPTLPPTEQEQLRAHLTALAQRVDAVKAGKLQADVQVQ